MRRFLPALLLAFAATAGGAAAQTPVSLTAKPVPLNVEDKTQSRAGPLLWRGGLALTANDPRFGGLSDLQIASDGLTLTAISDAGRWLTARLVYDADGNLAGIEDAVGGALRNPKGLLLSGKDEQDAEGLARLDDGSLVVSFERHHRFLQFGKDGIAGVPKAMTAPAGLARAGTNAGAEALVALSANRLLAFTEGQKAGDSYAVYLRDGGGHWQGLALKPKGLFVPTGAAQLPDGDVILLERRFTILGGLAARLRRIPLAAVRPGVLLEGSEIVELRAPLTLDNFEGIAVHTAPDGGIRLTLLSDDNFSPLQRTLIVQFELPGE